MARTSPVHLHHPNTDSFCVLEDQGSPSSSKSIRNLAGVNIPCAACGVLQEASINLGPSVKSATISVAKFSSSPSAGNTLNFELEKLQTSPSREANSISAERATPRRLRSRPAIGTQTFEPLDTEGQEVVTGPRRNSPAAKSEHQLEPIQEEVSHLSSSTNKEHPLMQLSANFPNLDDQVARNRAGQYDIRLSHPATLQLEFPRDETHPPRTGKRIVYGCNFVRRDELPSSTLKRSSGIADTLFVVASPIALVDDVAREEPKVLVDQMSPMMLENPLTPQKALEGETRPSLTPQGSGLSVNSLKSATSPVPRTTQIEDSVEALDKLEEELEAVNAVTHFGRVISPEMAPHTNGSLAAKTQKSRVKRTASNAPAKRPSTKPATVRVKPSEPRVSVGGSRSLSVGPEDRRPADGEDGPKQSHAMRKVQRPASLAAPKPLAKSGKPRTVPTFELPGESVARRLKEQKEARLSMQVSPDQAAKALQASLPQRAKSTKPPTRPTFELPGEAISRRKREEREVRIKADQEEERKRREFKARPIRTSFAPSTLPRETIASRARLNKAAHDDTLKVNTRRVSMAGTPTTNGSPQSRGRTTAMASSQVSRATSTSTGSGCGMHSTLSAEDAYHQKLRGQEVYARDNQFSEHKERERREREANAKIAREQAAERSRQLSREWAEKQRRKTQAHQAVASPTA